ncbi:hypothetical protein ALC53_12276 [Atta colombica]|uniref:Uncharacterized protein n=1 Tax=Atta colombica TaxID=520822 RepID=A0A195AZ32_9HYME|nr:hypothetical protein ALC53_12276 [Atta colombica]
MSIVMRLHPEGSVGAEAAPRTPCGKHCQRWCSTPPPASRQESSSFDTNFIKHSILLFLSLEKFTLHKNNTSSGQLKTGWSLDFDSSPPFPWPRIENTALRFPPRGGI